MRLYTVFLLCLLSLVSLIGIPGNILVILVYTNKRKRNGMRVFILCLAWVDLFICALTGYRFYLWIYEESFTSDFVCRLFSWIGLASEMSSAFITTAVAVDRYLAICRPHLGWMTHRRAVLVSAAGIVVSTILTVPTLTIYTVHIIQSSGAQKLVCEINVPLEYTSWVYIALFIMAISFACMMITALVMYMFIYREVRKRMKIRPSAINAPVVEKPSDKDQACKPVNLAGMLNAGDSIIGIALCNNKRLDGAGNDGGKVEGISAANGNHLTTGSPVARRRAPDDEQAKGSSAARVTTIASSSEDTVTDNGPKTKLTNDRSEPSDQTTHKAKKNKTGKMLLLATVVFVVTWTARFLMWVISYMLAEKWAYMKEYDEVAFAFLSLLQHLYYTTPAVNPAIYSFVNNKFKEECVRLLKKINCLRGSNM